MLGCFRRPQHHVLAASFFNHMGQVVTVSGRHVPRAAMRTIVVAHARPLVSPIVAAVFACVVVEEPCHVGSTVGRLISCRRYSIRLVPFGATDTCNLSCVIPRSVSVGDSIRAKQNRDTLGRAAPGAAAEFSA